MTAPPVDVKSPRPPVERTETARSQTIDGHRALYLPLPLIQPTTPIDRYVVIERLGEGGMGIVYAATDPDLERRVAIKLVRDVDLPGARVRRERLLREARAMARLDHPNVVRVFEAGTTRIGDQEHVFVAMELIAGASLGTWARGRPWRERMTALLGAGRGLAAAHAAGLIHRDVKPDNILVDAAGRPRIGDFGLAATPGDVLEASGAQPGGDLTRTGAVMGTPAFMAPEQHQGRAADARTDLFGFAVTAWLILYGEHPFDVADVRAAVLAGAIRPVTRGPVPRWVEPVLRRALAVDPADRYPSLQALLDQLDRRLRPSRWWWPPAALIVAGAIAAPLWLTRGAAPASCPSAAAQLRAAWGDADRATLAGRGGGADGTVAMFDRRFERWATLEEQACQAGRRGEPTAAPRRACAEQRRAELRGLFELLRDGAPELLRDGADLVSGLPDPALCDDPKRLFSTAEPPAAEQRQAVQDGRTDVTLAHTLLEHGRFDEAQAALDRVQPAGYAPLEAELGLERALLADLRTDSDAAEAGYRKVIATGAAARAADMEIRGMIQLADLMIRRRRAVEEIDGWLSLAEARLRAVGGWPDLEAHLYRIRSFFRTSRGDVDGAIADARSALATQQEVSGLDSADTAGAALDLGVALIEAGSHAEARQVLRDALARAEAAFPPEHRTIRRLRYNLANLAYQLGELDEAEVLYRAALDASLRSFGDTYNSDVHQFRDRLSAVLRATGRGAEALELLDQTLASARRRFPDGHSSTTLLLFDRAWLLIELDRYAEAAASAEEALVMEERIFGTEHRKLVETLTVLAVARFYGGDLAGAEAAARRAVELGARVLPEGSTQLGPPSVVLARTVIGTGRFAEGRRHADRAIAVTRGDDAWAEVHADAQLALALALEGLGDRAGAHAAARRALARFRETPEPRRDDIAEAEAVLRRR